VVWGWGQLAIGDRRGRLWLAAQPAALFALAALVGGYSGGSAVGAVFAWGAVVVAVWGGQALGAYRRALRRREALGLAGPDGGAVDLLWLAPVVAAAATLFWATAGAAAGPGTVLADYVRDWRAGRPDRAAALFGPMSGPSAEEIVSAWAIQEATIRNELVAIAAESGPGARIDPADPLASLRFEPPAGDGGGRAVVAVWLVRHETVRDSLLGWIPTTRERLVPVTRLGEIELVREARPGLPSPAGSAELWRIARVDLADTVVGDR
jgi:hypothetical protein